MVTPSFLQAHARPRSGEVKDLPEGCRGGKCQWWQEENGSLNPQLNDGHYSKNIFMFFPGVEENPPSFAAGIEKHQSPSIHIGSKEPSASTAAGMCLSIGRGKMRHRGWMGMAEGPGHATAFPQPGRAELEVFIKPIREQKEFSKCQSYITSSCPPLLSFTIIGSLGWGDLCGSAGEGIRTTTQKVFTFLSFTVGHLQSLGGGISTFAITMTLLVSNSSGPFVALQPAGDSGVGSPDFGLELGDLCAEMMHQHQPPLNTDTPPQQLHAPIPAPLPLFFAPSQTMTSSKTSSFTSTTTTGHASVSPALLLSRYPSLGYLILTQLGPSSGAGRMLSAAPSLWQPTAAVSRRLPAQGCSRAALKAQLKERGGGAFYRDAPPPILPSNQRYSLDCGRKKQDKKAQHRDRLAAMPAGCSQPQALPFSGTPAGLWK